MQSSNSNECLATGFRFSVTHDDPPFGQSEPHDGCGESAGDDSLARQPPHQQQQQQQHQQQQQDGGTGEKPVTCDYLSPYAFTARNSLGSTSDYTRRRRPITLKIVPRLSLPCRSTSAPTTTDADWPFTRTTDYSRKTEVSRIDCQRINYQIVLYCSVL
uniref:Uncharacterized protein n=1 Tax=Sipha flava TaxID=143950 RepID=A0A2S2R4C8_9HEMI